MQDSQEYPDPVPYIDRLSAQDAFQREAAAWSLGEIGSPRAARPLAGLLFRELENVERSGMLDHGAVVRAASVALRRLNAVEALYSLLSAVCTLVRAQGVDAETVEELVETIGAVGGPNAVREAADRVVRCVRDGRSVLPGLGIVASVLFARLSLCGDAALHTLRRVERGGPDPLRLYARRVLARAVPS